MARVDSGHETLFSDDSPCDLGATPSACSSSGIGSASSTGHVADPTPPKITPFSGVLGKGKVVIRPIAFKPVGGGMSPSARFGSGVERYGSTPILARPGSHLTLYGSSSDLRHPHTASSNYSLDRKFLSSSSSPPLAMASLTSLPVTAGRGYDSLESVRKSPGGGGVGGGGGAHIGHVSSGKQYHLVGGGGGDGGSVLELTPSPSDSGLAELEAALRDRDSELAYLRQTMEHNEQVIFRVYQEKERVWERELRRIKAVHENRLRAGAQKALRLEQMLMMQTYQLQQDKKRLREDLERATREAVELRQEVDLLRGRLEEMEWGLCQKTGEMSLLKAQLKDSQGEQTTKGHELLQLKGQVRDLKLELERYKEQVEETDRLRTENKRLSTELQDAMNAMSDLQRSKDSELERLHAELQKANEHCGKLQDDGREEDILRLKLELTGSEKVDSAEKSDALDEEVQRLSAELRQQKEGFDRERITWAQEKEKVLRYQRQLQLNYVQMFRRTKTLEAEVESLTMELELGTKTARKKQLPAIEMGHTIEL